MSFPGQHAPLRARLVSWREIAPDTRNFVFEIVDRETFPFVPGQFLSLTAELDDKPITRAYSIASVPDGNRVEFCLNLIPDGRFSRFLFGLKEGDEVEAKGPYGGFIFKPIAGDVLCVATGTGIAPFRSMLRQRLAADPNHEYTLIFGARHPHGLLYLDEFEQLERDHPHFHLVPTLTRPNEDWKGRTGRVQQPIREVIGDRRDLTVYICGLAAMVDDVRALLKEAGFDRKQIVYEKYD